MTIKLINGQFNAEEAIDILTHMIHIKVKYQERKISSECHEEDIKMREARIKSLQKDLYEARNFIQNQKNNLNLQSDIYISI